MCTCPWCNLCNMHRKLQHVEMLNSKIYCKLRTVCIHIQVVGFPLPHPGPGEGGGVLCTDGYMWGHAAGYGPYFTVM